MFVVVRPTGEPIPHTRHRYPRECWRRACQQSAHVLSTSQKEIEFAMLKLGYKLRKVDM